MIKAIVTTTAATAKEIGAVATQKVAETVKNVTNSLERTPVQDVFVSTKTSTAKKVKTMKSVQEQILIDYEFIKKEEFFNKEITHLLQPKILANGAKTFSSNQAKVINLAVKKVAFFKEIAQKLEKDGTQAFEKVIEDIKTVFGGEENYGKYLTARIRNEKPASKSATSIYNKLVKEFKDEVINPEIMNLFAKRNFQKPYKSLDKTEKALITLGVHDGDIKFETRDYKVLEKVLSTSKKDYMQAKAWVKDLVGLRMIIPDDADMMIAANYLTEAISNGKINVTRVSNYHANHIYPYISKDTLQLWKQLSPGMHLVQASSVRKQNGYTTTQMNLEHEIKNKSGKIKKVLVELQLRSEALNRIGQIEHLIYDIQAGKDIGGGIQKLDDYYNTLRIKDAVHDVFGNPNKGNAYLDYERAMYSWIRNNEKKDPNLRILDKPILTDFGLGEYENILSFESLERIDDTANIIKAKYGKANT